VKILIEMAPEHYDGLLTKCRDNRLAEYTALINGVVPHRQVAGVQRREIAILCETHQARNLLVIARSLNSPVVEDIKKALGYPREH
jgi:hypothetical protein